MADENDIAIAPGVTRFASCWGYVLRGRKEDLIAANVARPEWFADGTERNKRGQIVRTRRVFADGRKVECRQITARRFEVWCYYSEEEQERMSSAASIREKYERAKDDEAKSLAWLPASHERYREMCMVMLLGGMEERIGRWLRKGQGGYRFADEAVEEIEDAIAHVIELLETGRTTFRAADREKAVAAIKARTAQADPAFHSFMESLTQN